MNNPKQARHLINELLASQVQGVLATCQGEQPYTSLMAFAATPDLKRLIFATYRETYKYRNLVANPRVALLIDNRSGRIADHYDGIAVTATGTTRDGSPAERDSLLNPYLARHPNLAEFANSSDCALMVLEVEHYYLVSKFHDVVDWPIAQSP